MALFKLMTVKVALMLGMMAEASHQMNLHVRFCDQSDLGESELPDPLKQRLDLVLVARSLLLLMQEAAPDFSTMAIEARGLHCAGCEP